MRENPRTTPNTNATGNARRANPERAAQQAKLRQAQTGRQKQRRGWLILACLAVPPLGVAYMWAMQRYNMRSRIIISIISGALLFCECYMLFYNSARIPDPTVFTPGTGSVYAPVSATYEPTAIPSATDAPYDVVVAPGTTASVDVQTTPDPNAFVPSSNEVQVDGSQDAFVPSNTTASGDTQVYTAEGSLFYHAASTCGDKSYDTALTLSQALENGLAPCNRCNPPSQVG